MPRVLLCESDGVLARILIEFLKDERIDVTRCGALDEIESALRQFPDAVIVTDSWTTDRRGHLTEGERDGINQLAERAPVIVTTGRVWSARPGERELRPDVVVLPKPHDLDDLASNLQSALARRPA